MSIAPAPAVAEAPSATTHGGLVAARRAPPPWVLLALSVAVAVVLVLPLCFLLIEAHGAGTSTILNLIFRSLTASLLWNTVRLTVVVTVLCAVIGIAAAWFIERTDLPARRSVGCARRGAAGHPGLRCELRLGVAEHLGAGLPRRGARDDPGGVPAGVSAGRRQLPQRRPRPGGGRAQPRRGTPEHVLADHPGTGPDGDPRRLPARHARAAR